MTTHVDIKALLQKLNPLCTRALHAAAGRCVAQGHCEVTQEHLFRELAEDAGSDWGRILAGRGVDPGRLARALDAFLEGCPKGNPGRPVFAPHLIGLLQDAWLAASVELGEGWIRSGALLLALAARLPLHAGGGYLELLRPLGREGLLGDFAALTRGSSEAAPVDAGKAAGGFLERFCVDFTKNAREGRIDPVFGRDAEIRQIIDILARRRKNNPICVGDPGVGKTAVVEGLALRVVEGDVPGFLRGVELLALDMGLLEAGAGMKGEFEARLKGVIQEITASPRPVILFVDEAHTLVGAGGSPGGTDAANLLKPALARGELRTIAATTWTEYRKYFEKDPALARRFQPVALQAPSVEATVQILRGIRPHYEEVHGVIIRDDALVAAAELSDRHIGGRFLPDKAIDLLDTSCARIKVGLSARPAALEDKVRHAQALERERAALARDLDHGAPVDAARLRALEPAIAAALAEAAALEERWVLEKEAVARILELRAGAPGEPGLLEAARRRLEQVREGAPLLHHEVEPDVVAQVVSDWTGVPLGRLLRDEAGGLLDLEDRLGARIQGQDAALRTLAEGIRAAKAGIRGKDRPLGVFLLAGPSGTGKTETGRALAEQLFGSEGNLVAVNLGEFQEAHSVSRLVGPPPGYVGYGEGGQLTEAVRQRPYSVVLLDEAEKAHPDVMNLFHQVFDRGTLRDGEGKEISFRNTVILLTSNLPAGPGGASRAALARAFKPSLLARMAVVPYLPLDARALRAVAGHKLERVREALWTGSRMAMEIAPGVAELLAERCGALESGARGLDLLLDRDILPRLSREVLARMGAAAWPQARLEVGPDGEPAFRFGAPDSAVDPDPARADNGPHGSPARPSRKPRQRAPRRAGGAA